MKIVFSVLNNRIAPAAAIARSPSLGGTDRNFGAVLPQFKSLHYLLYLLLRTDGMVGSPCIGRLAILGIAIVGARYAASAAARQPAEAALQTTRGS
jgi:hypothetical protein